MVVTETGVGSGLRIGDGIGATTFRKTGTTGEQGNRQARQLGRACDWRLDDLLWISVTGKGWSRGEWCLGHQLVSRWTPGGRRFVHLAFGQADEQLILAI